MDKKMVKELMIPKCEARAFEVMRGQILRVIEIEGKQVGDMAFFDLHNYKEKFSAMTTGLANGRCFSKATKLYSGPPDFNVMVSIIDDKIGVHWVHGRCTKLMYKLLHGLEDHRNCQDNIVEALRPYGIAEYDIPLDTFNVFMKGIVDENGYYSFEPPATKKGDYVDFLAEMDLLVVISACPEDLTAINDYLPKPLKVEIYEPA